MRSRTNLLLIGVIAALSLIAAPAQAATFDVDFDTRNGTYFVIWSGKTVKMSVAATSKTVSLRLYRKQDRFGSVWGTDLSKGCKGYGTKHLECSRKQLGYRGGVATIEFMPYPRHNLMVTAQRGFKCGKPTKSLASLFVHDHNTIGSRVVYGSHHGDTFDLTGNLKSKLYGCGGNDALWSGGGTKSFGGTGNDWLQGSGRGTVLKGQAGNDNLEASHGAVAIGGAGNDTMKAIFGANAFGNAGNDYIDQQKPGNRGHSILNGGRGNDRILSHAATRNTVIGGAGNDFLHAGEREGGNKNIGGVPYWRKLPGRGDRVRCGTGRDTVTAGRNSRLSNCERIIRLPYWENPIGGRL